jgi:DNA-binding NtrC family response regulator
MTKLTTINDAQTNVLIVDDNLQYTQVLKRILQGAFGYLNITSVDNTAAAYDLIAKEPEKFQLLFIDYNFPTGETGGALLEKLKQTELMDNRVAFLITSEPTVENVKEATQAGAMGVVAKPFSREELKKQLEKAERSIVVDNTESF